jgi:hypothetical protein
MDNLAKLDYFSGAVLIARDARKAERAQAIVSLGSSIYILDLPKAT